MAQQVTKSGFDPVFVGPVSDGRVELRIGESRQGESRISFLTQADARRVAIALLLEAEKASGDSK
jgi:hypothetical protein